MRWCPWCRHTMTLRLCQQWLAAATGVPNWREGRQASCCFSRRRACTRAYTVQTQIALRSLSVTLTDMPRDLLFVVFTAPAACTAFPPLLHCRPCPTCSTTWPRVTFRLPVELSAPGNIIRAQLLVTPKADACEEFWAMNPSGAGTNNTCGGLTTGEPYREVGVGREWLCLNRSRCISLTGGHVL